MMKKRAAIVEHPFGTLKHRAGINHFLMRGLEKCRGEFSLMTLAYNFSRVLRILGKDFIEGYCVQRVGKCIKNFSIRLDKEGNFLYFYKNNENVKNPSHGFLRQKRPAFGHSRILSQSRSVGTRKTASFYTSHIGSITVRIAPP